MKLRHLFIPHTQTHAKAHLLHWHSLFIYALLFLLLQFSFQIVQIYKPGVLGVNSNITVEEVIAKTNVERAKMGLPPVQENKALDKAAQAKAANMFEENYWAHFAPSGKDPWGFINGAGYRFSYAGENLARNFYTTDEVVKAWMASPTHKANVLNPNYQDIGIAVVDGVLLGQKTTLIVQEFGRPYDAVAQAPQVDLSGKSYSLTPEQLQTSHILTLPSNANVQAATIDPYRVTRTVGMMFVFFLGLLLVLDMLILKSRGVFRFSSHHFAHLMLLVVVGTALGVAGVGSIL